MTALQPALEEPIPTVTDQRCEDFDPIPRDQVIGFMRRHVAAMEASEGEPEQVWVQYNMWNLLLRTVGRRSGRIHKVALPYWLDGSGHPIVAASNGGSERDPAWYLNLTDRDANPQVHLKMRYEAQWARAEILEGDEHATIWEQLVRDRPYLKNYQDQMVRRIPLVRFVKEQAATEMPPGEAQAPASAPSGTMRGTTTTITRGVTA